MLTRQSRSHRMLGGIALVCPIWRERQNSPGSLQVYSGPALVRGASGSAGGQQYPFKSPHAAAASSAAKRPFAHRCMQCKGKLAQVYCELVRSQVHACYCCNIAALSQPLDI